MNYLRMTEPVLLILLSLADQPRHGYAILQDTEQMSNGRVRLSTGTLYGALRRLLEDGWIERLPERRQLSWQAGLSSDPAWATQLATRSEPLETSHSTRRCACGAQGDLVLSQAKWQ